MSTFRLHGALREEGRPNAEQAKRKRRQALGRGKKRKRRQALGRGKKRKRRQALGRGKKRKNGKTEYKRKEEYCTDPD
jgi:hypothetical protein